MTPQDLKAFRLAHALTQPQLAAALGVTTQSVFRWEKGTRRLPLFIDLAIARLRDLARERTAQQTAEETGR